MSELRVNFPKPCSEKWEEMSPSGCNRDCSVCDTTVHDLASLTVEQAEELLDSETKVCVRARVSRDGAVALAGSRGRAGRRMVAAISASLAVAACQTSPLDPVSPRFGIAGQVSGNSMPARAVLTAENGRVYDRNIKPDGPFRIGNLPAGK